MNASKVKSGDWSNRIKKNTRILAYWAAAYVVTMALATFGPKYIWDYNDMASIAAMLLNAIVGFGMIYANIRHLKKQDELMQKIQLEAMALSLGIGIVAGLSYSLADASNIIGGDAEISNLVILIGLVYIVSIIINYRRYK